MQYPGAVTLINKAEYWFVSKLEHGADNDVRSPVTWNYIVKQSAFFFLACHQLAAQQFLTQSKAASHFQFYAMLNLPEQSKVEYIVWWWFGCL